jgi:STE24 endopeptidase
MHGEASHLGIIPVDTGVFEKNHYGSFIMKSRQFLLGAGAGIGAGYAAIRILQAWAALRAPAPPASSDSARYGKMRRALAVAGAARNVIGSAAFAYGPLARDVERALRCFPQWARPGAFFGVAAFAGALAELPGDYVEDHLLERAYGLTKQLPRAWASEALKSALIGAAVSSVIGALAGAALRRFPRTWPAIASLGLLPLLMLANVVVPLVILPMFNAFEPLTGPLEERLRALATKLGVGHAAILRMDMSRQTKKANAFVTGIGNTHRIVLGDTLIDRFEPAEAAFVVAHEIGHYVAKDTWRTIAVAEASAALLLFTASRCVKSEDGPESLRLLRAYAVLVAGMTLLQPAINAFSRSREWAADRFARAATNDAQAGAAAFRRLRDQNLAEEDVPAWYEFFFGSHPSLRKRIEALEHS